MSTRIELISTDQNYYSVIWGLTVNAARKMGCEEQLKKIYGNEQSIKDLPLEEILNGLESAWRDSKAEERDLTDADLTYKEKCLADLQKDLWILSREPSNTDHAFKFFHRMFEEKVQSSPKDHPAILFRDDRPWSYEELNGKANQLARALIKLKNEKGDFPRVGLFFENTPEAIASILAVMKAGLSYVPLTKDRKLSNERLAFYLKQSKPQLLLVQDELMNDSGGFVQYVRDHIKSLKIISYGDLQEKAKTESLENLPEKDVEADAEVYTIFTSGSTGIPKGIRVSHRGLCNAVEYVRQIFEITKEDRIAWYSLLTFDASLLDIMTALGNGATSVIIPHDIRSSGTELTTYLEKHKVSMVSLVPPVLAMLDVRKLPELRAYISMGQRGQEKILKEFKTLGRKEGASPRICTEGYGPSEATICFLIAIIEESIHLGKKCVPGSKAYLLGLPTKEEAYPKFPKKVNEGEEAELYISGDALALGYLDETSVDQKRFRYIPDPDDPKKYIRVYQTGDVFQIKNGNFEFVRRVNKTQYKMDGEQVHPFAIKAALDEFKYEFEKDVQSVFLNTHVDVENYDTINKQPYIRAFIELKKDVFKENIPEDLIPKIISHLRHHPYCTVVPSRFSIVTEWPTSVNDKLDEKELKNKVIKTLYLSHPFKRMPSTPLQLEIKKIWEKILDINPEEYMIGLDDNFDELGGESVSRDAMLILVSEISKKYQESGVHIDRTRFDRHPTIGALVDQVSRPTQPGCVVQCLNGEAEFKSESQKFPIIFINSITGDANGECGHIINYFKANKSEWPLLYTKSISLDNPDYSVSSLPMLATDNITSLFGEEGVLKQYKGPVILVGYSAAGTLASEIAHQLEKRGRGVALCCIDTLCANYYQNLSQLAHATEIVKMISHMRGNIGLSKSRVEEKINVDSLREYAKSEQLIECGKLLMHELRDATDEDKEKYLKNFSTIYNLIQHQLAYKPKPVNCSTLITFSESRKGSGDKNLGWDPTLFSNIVELDGEHLDVVKIPDWVQNKLIPNVENFCEKVHSNLLLNALIKKQRSLYQESPKKFLNDFPEFIHPLYINKNLKDIAERTTKIKNFNVKALLDSRKSKKILITGQLGTGKTRFSQLIVDDWMCGDLKGNIFKLVVCCSLGELNQNTVPNELIEIYSCLEILAKDILFIFDGYDTLDSQSSLADHIKKILILESVSAIVTSSPTVTDLRKLTRFGQWIELDLNRESIEKFIFDYFKNETNLAQGLIDSLEDKKLKDLLRSPLLILILCQYWQETATSTQGTFVLSDFINFVVDKFWDRFSNRVQSKLKYYSPSSDHIFGLQERAQNILESLAKRIWPRDQPNFSTQDLDSEIRQWYMQSVGDHLGDDRLSQLRSELLNTGFVFGLNQDIRDVPQTGRFCSPMVVEYLTVQYLTKHMNQENYTEFKVYHSLSKKYPILYDPERQNEENEFLRLLLETKPISSFSPKDKGDLNECIKSGFKNNHVEKSALYRFIQVRVKDEGIKKIESEFRTFKEEYEEYDFETILINILNHKSDDSLLKYINQDAQFFEGRTLYLSDPNGRFSTQGEIIAFNRGNGRIQFTLDDDSTLMVALGLDRSILKVFTTRKQEYCLSNYLIKHLLDAKLHKNHVIDIKPSHEKVLDKTIKTGRYVLSVVFVRQEDNDRWYKKAGKEIVKGVEFLTGLESGITGKKFKRTFKLEPQKSQSHYESHQIDIYDFDKEYVCEVSKPENFIIEVKSIINGKEIEAYKIGLRELESYKIDELFQVEVTGITPENAKDNIKVVKIYNESKEKLKTSKEIDSLKEQIFQALSDQKNQSTLNAILFDLIKNQLKNLSEDLIAKISTAVVGIPNLKDYLTRITKLSEVIGVETSEQNILISISLKVNYSQIAPKKDGINVLKVMKLLDKAFKHIEFMENKVLLLVIGNTGAGKSTFITYLQGVPLKADQKLGQMIIDVKDKESFDPTLSPKIGHSLGHSETKYVQAYKIIKVTKSLAGIGDTIRLSDTPGQKDTRGIEYDLSTTLSIDKTIASADSIKAIVLPITYEAFLFNRGNPVVELFDDFKQQLNVDIFTDQNVKQSIFIVITKHYAYPDAESTIKSRIEEMLIEDNSDIDKLKSKSVSDNSLDSSVLQNRIKIWNMLRDKLFTGSAFFFEIQDKAAREKILKLLTTAPGIDKKLFNKAMRREKVQREFGNNIQMALHTWKTQIMGGYIDVVRKIYDGLSEIAKINKEIDLLRGSNRDEEKTIKDLPHEISLIKLNINKLIELKKADSINKDDELVRELQKASAKLKSEDLENQNIKLELMKKEIKTKTLELASKAAEKELTERDLNKQRDDLLQLTLTKNKLSTGSQKILLREIKYEMGQTLRYHTKTKDGALQSSYLEVRELRKDEILEEKEGKIGEIDFPLCYQLYIEKEYRIVPIDTQGKPMEIFFDIATNIRRATRKGGDYIAHLEGIGFEPDPEYGGGVPRTNSDGTKIIYPIRMVLKGNTLPLPWLRISHDVPNFEIYAGRLRNIESDIEGKKVRISDGESKVRRLTDEENRLRLEINSLNGDLSDVEKEIKKIEKDAIQSEIEPYIKQCEATIKRYEGNIDAATQRIQRNAESEKIKRKRKETVQFELIDLRNKKKRIAIIIKTQSKIATLLRKFAALGIGDDLGIDKMFTQKDLVNDCLNYISFYDMKFVKLLKACEKDLSNQHSLEEEIEDLKDEIPKEEFKPNDESTNKKFHDEENPTPQSSHTYSSSSFFKSQDKKSNKRWASIDEFADENGFKLRKTVGDGNCLFSSIAILLNHLKRTTLTHAQIRQEAIKYIRTHSEVFADVFGEGLDYGTQGEYLKKMAKDKVWAIGPIVDAIALCYGIRLDILDFRENGDLHFAHINQQAVDKPLLTLCRTGEDDKCQHYDALLTTTNASKESTYEPGSSTEEKQSTRESMLR